MSTNQQHVYDSDGAIISFLTNGEFATNDSPSYNRYDGQVGRQYIIHAPNLSSVHTLQISAGNAAWGGTEMPKDIGICRYIGLEEDAAAVCADKAAASWEEVGTILYAAPNGANDRAAAEMQTFPFDSFDTLFVRMTVLSNWGNGSSAVFRQVAVLGQEGGSASDGSASSDSGSGSDDPAGSTQSIGSLCADTLTVFAELKSDRDTVSTCQTMLGKIHECGVDVASAIGPLGDQANHIQGAIDGFAERFREIQVSLEELLAEMRAEADKVGPLGEIPMEA